MNAVSKVVWAVSLSFVMLFSSFAVLGSLGTQSTQDPSVVEPVAAEAEPLPTPLISYNPWMTYNGTTVYHSNSEMETELFWIAETHPDITKLISIGKSWKGRDIWAMKVSDNPNVEEAGEPEVYFNANHHSREWMTIEISLYLLNYLTDFYATNSTITNIVNNRQIWVIPSVNPDGRVYDGAVAGDDPANHGLMYSGDTTYGWRKNQRDNNNNAVFEYNQDGVDLNRNYGYLWGASGATADTTYDTYGGPYPFSEPETAAVRDFCRVHNFVFAISYHTSSQLILYPWGWSYEDAPDKDVFVSVGAQMRSRITNTALSDQTTYTLQKSSGLYPTAGSDDDWLYGELGMFAYCIEAYPAPADTSSGDPAVTGTYDSFHPAASKVLPVCQDNLPAALLLCQIANNPYVYMDHVSIKPETADMTIKKGAAANAYLNVTDDGRRADTFYVNRTAISGWSYTLPASSTMAFARNETKPLTMGITVSGTALPGLYKIWVNATSTTNKSCKDSTLITVNVPYPDDVSPITLEPFTELGDFPKGQYRIDSTVKNVGEVSVPVFNTQLTIKQLGTGSAVTLFQDNIESALTTQWTTVDHDTTYSTSVWARSTTQKHLGTYSAWCGVGSAYTDNTIQSLMMTQPISLERYNSATMQFWSYFSTELYYDFLMVEGSGDNGKSWDYIERYHGAGTAWTLRTLDLSDFLGAKEFKLRFRFTSDDATTAIGFYLDDVIITANDPTEAPFYGPVSLPTSGTLASGASQELSWICNLTTAGTFLAEVQTLYVTDGNAANNVKSAMFYINNSRTLPEFGGIKSVTNPGMGNSLQISWDAALQINDPLTYRVYRFDHAPSLAEVNAASPIWSGTSTSYSNTGLTIGQTYYYVVRATDARSQAEFNIVTLSGSPGITVDQWGSSGLATTETRYMRGVASEAVVNGLTAYSLGLAQSTVAGNWAPGNNLAIYLGMRVYRRSSAGIETEISSGLVATVARTVAGSGFQTATWTPPVTTLNAGDSIVVKVYGDTTANPTTLRATFTTGQIGPVRLDANQWTIQYWTRYAGNPNGSDWYWGTATYDNNIAGFKWSVIANPLDDNTVNWTTGGANIAQYNVYRSSLQSGPWDVAHRIATVSSDTFTYLDTGKGQADAILWWYVIRGVDGYGTEETNTNAVQEPGAGTPYAIPLAGKLANSWVFISYPVTVSGHIETVLNDTANGDGGTNWDVAKTWSNTLKRWLSYRKGSAPDTFTNVSNTMGVWLHITANGADQALSLPSTGAYPGITIINLYLGWNLVGYPTATSMAETATLTNAFIDLVASWQAASPYITQHAKGATLMVPGNAYWVHVTADCTWTVAP